MASPVFCHECGNCLRRGGNLEQPKSLSCGHVHCLPCLCDAGQINNIICCPTSNVAINCHPNHLPSAVTPEGDSQSICATCEKKGMGNVPAVHYCMDEKCKEMYCERHKWLHDELMEGHSMVTISEYTKQSAKYSRRFCTQHTDKPVTMGCKRCRVPLCMDCLEDSRGCHGSYHQAVRLSIIFNEVKEMVEEMNKQAEEKKIKLSALSTECTQVLSEYDNETENMRKLIHTTRDRQIKVLTDGYGAMERELIAAREKPRNEIVEFKERNVERSFEELSNKMKALADGISAGHEADGVNCYNKASEEVSTLLTKKLPAMTGKVGVTKLANNGTNRKLELRTVTSHGGLSVGVGKKEPAQPNSFKPYGRQRRHVIAQYFHEKRLNTKGQREIYNDDDY